MNLKDDLLIKALIGSLNKILTDAIEQDTGYPAETEITDNDFKLWYNTTANTLRLYFNNSGSLYYYNWTFTSASGACVYGTGTYGACIYA